MRANEIVGLLLAWKMRPVRSSVREALHFDPDRPLADDGKSKETVPALASVVDWRDWPVRVFCRVTVAPGRSAPEASATAPDRSKVLTWAAADDEISSHPSDRMKTCRLQRMTMRFPPGEAENQLSTSAQPYKSELSKCERQATIDRSHNSVKIENRSITNHEPCSVHVNHERILASRSTDVDQESVILMLQRVP